MTLECNGRGMTLKCDVYIDMKVAVHRALFVLTSYFRIAFTLVVAVQISGRPRADKKMW
jgi:hypothetical protein